MDARAVDDLTYFLDRLQEARRSIAIAKLEAFARETEDIAAELPEQWHDRARAALQDMAIANGLVRIHGQDLIDDILAAGFGDVRQRR